MSVCAVRCRELSSPYDERWIVVDALTGDVLANNWGEGYDSEDEAYIAYAEMLEEKAWRKRRESHVHKAR